MKTETLGILRCPYCGGRLVVVESSFHRSKGDEIQDAILACHCCVFPVVAGIPLMHLQDQAVAARQQVEAGQPDLAMRTMLGFENEDQASAFERAASSGTATYREIVDSLGPGFEGGYFLYRFSDPTYVVAEAVVRAVAGTVLADGGRAIDLCGGSGHLTRSLLGLSPTAPVLADLYFAKIWLARHFTAPGCEGVCYDANSPLPFARGAFRYAMCSDAFQYVWTKRLSTLEMLRLVDDGCGRGAVVISHAHNERQWSPSHGQPLPPEGYRDLFETAEPRLFAEAGLLTDVVKGGPLDLSRRDDAATLDSDPALTIVATQHPAVFAPHALQTASVPRGEFRLNPLYSVQTDGNRVTLRLQFPSLDYEDEYGLCRRYLPDEIEIERASLLALEHGDLGADVANLVRHRVVLDLPKRYY
jgi:uncharacterized protein YbaR (Trm112 family)